MKPTTTTSFPANRRRTSVLVLCLLAALGPCTVDLYLPALPILQSDLGIGAAAAQFTLTATTLGFAIGQLMIGPWSDAAGRRAPLLIATGVHVVASFGVAFAPSIEWVLAFRLLQGVGSAGTGVVAMAMVRDAFDGSDFVKVLSRLALVTGIAPVIAPFLGAVLMGWVDWRGIFVTVALYGAIAWILSATLLAETLPPEKRTIEHAGSAASRYKEVLGDPSFVGIALIGGLIVSGVFTYMTTSSIVYQRVYGLTSQSYGLVFAINAVSFVIGTQAAARIIRGVKPRTMLRFTLPTLALAGYLVVPAGALGVPGVTVVTALFMLAAGMSIPSLQVLGMARHGRRAGTAAALLGAVNFGLAGLTSPIASSIGTTSVGPMGLVMGATETLAVVILHTVLMKAPEVLEGIS